MAASLETWALPRLQQLLPLDEESLKQVVQYADSLPKGAAAEHLKNLLGDESKALEFISSFNMRRQNAPGSAQTKAQAPGRDTPQGPAVASSRGGGVPQVSGRGGRGGKKRANIHALPPRRVEESGSMGGGTAYSKHDEQDYIPRAERSRQTHKELIEDNMALRERAPDATQMPLITDNAAATSKPFTSKAPPSAAGHLISDSLAPRKPSSSAPSSRTASPAPKAKVNISGGTAMHGASSALSDLDSAIRTLEIQTNPSLSPSAAEDQKRQCTCMATRHPILAIAPNCLNCGKIICVKQGLGPCTFCHTPLLSAEDLTKVLRVLKDERGDAKQQVNNASHKKADVALGKARAYTGRDFLAQHAATSSPLSSNPATPAGSDDEAVQTAKAHRDKLLTYQAHNARRTQVHDEAADFDVPASGTSMWASPMERARQLKRQQRVLQEQEWASRPEWDRRRVVASIDLKGGRVVRRMAEVERPDFAEVEGDDDDGEAEGVDETIVREGSGRGGAFSRNPLAKGLIRPVAREVKGKERERQSEKGSTWQRVQMDEDNEAWILDGGVYGGREPEDRALGEEEHAFG
ncbi:hypothetical protein LTR35_000672 [Friedmanniomyces endolithicus]|uniref:TRIP4/RQT4 C2HC5-type zinc finger domain-containing protein n=1 Tax=Friedmanniomyces endolithicus TaxID=329885 RepID=A0AAN6F5W3_9PEZI|nr:hypothetical protein LTS00_012191 [Friedmanniomyces endolithicus]KAK0292641.1 hypothetical protein LTR35_000672 [Friedmanniomyces endolithicus]KAK0305991.1 hypothetical protein LTR82_016547 [Friedmanniomyces endolithicus]KAK1007617.1 hypothetical protein LTR54_006343 [Friedmanniomyces endolithicus]